MSKSPDHQMEEFMHLSHEDHMVFYTAVSEIQHGTGFLLAVDRRNKQYNQAHNHVHALIDIINEIRALENPTKESIEEILRKQRSHENS